MYFKKTSAIFLSLITTIVLLGCNSNDDSGSISSPNLNNSIVSIQIENAPNNLAKGQKIQLVVLGKLITGEDIPLDNNGITWTSSNINVINFLTNGEAVAVGEGVVVIEASYFSHSFISEITVTKPIVEGIEILPSKLNLISGFSNSFSVNFVNSDKSTTPITHFNIIESSDINVATVSNNTIIKGVGAGSSVINLEVSDPVGSTYTGVINVDVSEIKLSSIRLPSAKIMLGTNISKRLEVTGYFEDGSTYDISNDITLIENDPSIISVNKNGITGLNIGKTSFKARYHEVESELIEVHVNNIDIVSTLKAFAATKSDRSIMSWGTAMYGGYSVEIADQLFDTKSLIANQFGFAVLREDNTVISWGTLWDAGKYFFYHNVKEIVATKDGWAFAALTNDDKVISWGHNSHGADPSNVLDKLINVKKIYPGSSAFVAVKKDGSVVTWGHPKYGGDSSTVKSKLVNVKDIVANSFGFAALKNDGTVVAWGDPQFGGSTTGVDAQLTNVKKLYFNNVSFAALKNDGTVITWGEEQRGGNSSKVQTKLTGVTKIYSNPYAYVALKNDGSTVVWGVSFNGGDSSQVQSKLINLKAVYSTEAAFAAIDANNNVITWGDYHLGGSTSEPQNLVNVDKIASTSTAFAALKKDGTVVSWGEAELGGDSSMVSNELYDIIDIFGSHGGAFAAVRKDGILITWGEQEAGGCNVGAELYITSDSNNK